MEVKFTKNISLNDVQDWFVLNFFFYYLEQSMNFVSQQHIFKIVSYISIFVQVRYFFILWFHMSVDFVQWIKEIKYQNVGYFTLLL
jgi:hypothetical protein